jgi:predicted restriction endonuclease
LVLILSGGYEKCTHKLLLHGYKAGSITVGEITNESFKDALEKMSPAAKAQWDQLGRRLALYSSIDESHPLLSKFQWFPIVGWFYRRKKLDFVLTREPSF